MTDHAQVVTAHRLTDGIAVFWTGDGWSEQFSEARPLADQAGVERALAAGDEARRLIVNAYAFDITIGGGPARPRRQRERIRISGRPTVACGVPAPGV